METDPVLEKSSVTSSAVKISPAVSPQPPPSKKVKSVVSSGALLFELGDTTYEIPNSILSDYNESGLAYIVKKRGFKDIPPVVPKNDSTGAYILTSYRHPLAFGLMVEHLLGSHPLSQLSIADIPDAFIALKSELSYWQIVPNSKVRLPIRLWTQSAWCDELCVYPLTKNQSMTLAATSIDSPQLPQNMRRLSPVMGSAPSEIAAFIEDKDLNDSEIYQDGTSGVFALNSNRFIAKLEFAMHPCVVFGKFVTKNSDRVKECGKGYEHVFPAVLMVSATEVLVVWNLYTFFHIKLSSMEDGINSQLLCQSYAFKDDKPSWLCIHPISGLIMTSQPGPVPHVFAFDMTNGKIVKFTPWGSIVLQEHVDIEACGGTEPSGATGSDEKKEEREPKVHLIARIMRLAPNGKPLRPFAVYLTSEGITPKKKNTGTIGTLVASTQPATYRYGADYDIIDRRLEDGRFQMSLMMTGTMVSRISDSSGSEDTAVFLVQPPCKESDVFGSAAWSFAEGGLFPYQQGVSIKSGGPKGEKLCNFYTLGEFDTATGLYSTFPLSQKLYDYNAGLVNPIGTNSSGGTCALQ